MKKLLALLLAAAFSLGTAFAEDDTEAKISTLDANDDGLLDRQEVSMDQELSARFDELDANGDGLLGEDEIDEGPIDDFDEIGDDPVDE